MISNDKYIEVSRHEVEGHVGHIGVKILVYFSNGMSYLEHKDEHGLPKYIGENIQIT